MLGLQFLKSSLAFGGRAGADDDVVGGRKGRGGEGGGCDVADALVFSWWC
jgi:hypothetical protein